LKKTWVDIQDVGQKGVIQDVAQDGRRTLIPSIARAAVGMGIPMGIPMGMGMVWVWGL